MGKMKKTAAAATAKRNESCLFPTLHVSAVGSHATAIIDLLVTANKSL